MQTNSQMQTHLPLLFLTLFAFTLTSCKEKLTREKAQEIISQKRAYPIAQTTNQLTLSYLTMETLYSPNQNEHNRPGKIKSDLAELERRGLVTYDIQLVERKVGNGTWWDGGAPGRGNGWSISRPGYAFAYEIKETYRHIGNVTALGNQYISFENGRPIGKTGNIQFDIINGVAEEPDGITAQVQYTEKFTDITPIGEYLGKQEERFPKNCIFKRYDDGWRMEK